MGQKVELINKVIKIISAITIGIARKEGFGASGEFAPSDRDEAVADGPPQNDYLKEQQNLFSVLNRFYVTEPNKRKFNI